MIYDESDKLLRRERRGRTAAEEEDLLNLRPKALSEYVGQEKVGRNPKDSNRGGTEKGGIAGAHPAQRAPWPREDDARPYHRKRDEHEDCDVFGTGAGKGGDLMGLLTNMEKGDIFFIDEIHRIPKIVEEFLYPAMEDFAVDFIFDRGVHARTHRYRLEQFTLIGATTRAGLLSRPSGSGSASVRDLDFYQEQDLVRIVKRSALILKVAYERRGGL